MNEKKIASRVAQRFLQALSDKQQEYREFFEGKLEEYGVDSPAELSEEDKKKFFNEVDKGWKGEKTAGRKLGPGIPDGAGPMRGTGQCPYDEDEEDEE